MCEIKNIKIFHTKQVVGPMLRFAEDLIPMMKVLCFNENSDCNEKVVKPNLQLDDNVSKQDINIRTYITL